MVKKTGWIILCSALLFAGAGAETKPAETQPEKIDLSKLLDSVPQNLRPKANETARYTSDRDEWYLSQMKGKTLVFKGVLGDKGWKQNIPTTVTIAGLKNYRSFGVVFTPKQDVKAFAGEQVTVEGTVQSITSYFPSGGLTLETAKLVTVVEKR